MGWTRAGKLRAMPAPATVLLDGDWLTAVFHNQKTGVPFEALAAALEETCGPLDHSKIYISGHQLDALQMERLSDLGLKLHTKTIRRSTLDLQMGIDAIGFAAAASPIVLVTGAADFVPGC